MKNNCFIVSISVLLFLFSSCGVITKARYGNGLKINMEFNRFKKEDHLLSQRKVKIKKAKSVLTLDTLPGKVQQIGLAPLEKMVFSDQTEPGSLEKSISKSKKKTIRGVGDRKRKEISRQEMKVIRPERLSVKQAGDPIEPNTLIAGILFYGSIALSLILTYSGILLGALGTLLSICLLVGFIMALVGLRKIKQSDYAYSGYGLAISIVVVFILSILLYLAIIILFLALFI